MSIARLPAIFCLLAFNYFAHAQNFPVPAVGLGTQAPVAPYGHAVKRIPIYPALPPPGIMFVPQRYAIPHATPGKTPAYPLIPYPRQHFPSRMGNTNTSSSTLKDATQNITATKPMARPIQNSDTPLFRKPQTLGISPPVDVEAHKRFRPYDLE